MLKLLCFAFAVLALDNSYGLLFRPDQFKDMTETCRKSNGKPIRFILNEDNPAMYVSVDPAHPTLMAMHRAERVKLFNKFTLDDKGRLLLQVWHLLFHFLTCCLYRKSNGLIFQQHKDLIVNTKGHGRDGRLACLQLRWSEFESWNHILSIKLRNFQFKAFIWMWPN